MKSTPKLGKYFFLKERNYNFFETHIVNQKKIFINNFITLTIENQRNYDVIRNEIIYESTKTNYSYNFSRKNIILTQFFLKIK